MPHACDRRLLFVLVVQILMQTSQNSHAHEQDARTSAMLDTGTLRITIAGYFKHTFGLAESGRQLFRAAKAAHLPVQAFNINYIDDQVFSNDESITAADFTTQPGNINVLNINAAQIKDTLASQGSVFSSPETRNMTNVAVWYWELEQFPVENFPGCTDGLTEIWTTTRFVQDAISARVDVPVRLVRMPVSKPHPSAFDWNAELGIKPTTFVFVFSFDYTSYYPRKNPEGVLLAFSRAFHANNDVAFVLKSSNLAKAPNAGAHWQALQKSFPSLVRFIDRDISSQDMDALLARANCYVSLHRAEGLGIGMLKAMSLGKPVIATNYSGNVDFMRPGMSYPIGYRLVPLTDALSPYTVGSVWAEPDLDHAVEMMRLVVSNTSASSAVGAAARKYVQEHYSYAAAGRLLARRLHKLVDLQQHGRGAVGL